MKHSLLLFGFLSLIIVTVSAQNKQVTQNDAFATEFLDNYHAKNSQLKHWKVDFKLSISVPEQEEPNEQQGTFEAAGEQFKLNLNQMELISNGKTLWTVMPDVQEVQVTDYNPADQELNLANLFSFYREGYMYRTKREYNNSKGVPMKVIELTPTNKTEEYFKIDLTFEGNAPTLRSVMIYAKNGVRTNYQLSDIQKLSAASSTHFTFQPSNHPEFEVIDLRE